MLAPKAIGLALIVIGFAACANSYPGDRQHDTGATELLSSKEEVDRLRRMEKDVQLEIKAVNLYDRIRKSQLDNRNLGFRLGRLIRQSNSALNKAVGSDDRMLEERVEGSKYAWQQCKDVGAMASSASTQEDYDNVCAFVKERCKPKDGLINYVEVPYCWMPNATLLAGVVLFVWILVLFVWLMAMVDFLIPSLATMSRMCMLRQSVAGVTFLAIGNGSSDLFRWRRRGGMSAVMTWSWFLQHDSSDVVWDQGEAIRPWKEVLLTEGEEGEMIVGAGADRNLDSVHRKSRFEMLPGRRNLKARQANTCETADLYDGGLLGRAALCDPDGT
eukprot:752720-Hanusia_phi.AAC.1